MSCADWLKVWPQYVLPQHGLSACAYALTRTRVRWLKNVLIRAFIAQYKVNMQEAAQSDSTQYQNFNAFFTRTLKTGARPLPESPNALASPVDGAISQIGLLRNNMLIQAKGREYSVEALLGGDVDNARRFHGGAFATLYLSPRDYHRIHMPCDGTLKEMVYVPGRLFSVNSATTRQVDCLFSRNERVICYFDTDHGRMAIVMVGAIFVGSIETTWAGEITPASPRQMACWRYDAKPQDFARGQEIGRFNMGSTVILLFEPAQLQWADAMRSETAIRQGQSLGVFT
ncbi:MAG: archaetidylserine decarboxylase [Gammaproteobacteria bacterium]